MVSLLVLHAVYKFCRPHRLSFGVILLFLVVESVYGALTPLSFKFLIDDAFLTGNINIFWLVLALLLGGGVLAYTAAIFGERMLALVTERILYRVRWQMFDQLMRQSPDFYNRYEQGTLVSRATSDIGAVDRVISSNMPNAFRELLSLGVGILLLFQLQWKLAIALVIGFVLLFLSPNILRPQAKRSSADYREAHDDYVSAINEMLSGHRVIKGLHLRSYMMGKMEQKLRAIFTTGFRLIYIYSLLDRIPLMTFMLLNAGVITFGGILIFQNDLSVGAFIAFYTIFLSVGQSVTSLSQILPSLMQAEASFKRIEEILNITASKQSTSTKVQLDAINECIQFEQVHFRYGEKMVALDDITFDIPAGGLTAFVGPSGSGKSTALQLLTRLYSPGHGTIKIDGTDILDIDEEYFYRLTGVVFQDSFLFHASIEENIRVSTPDASMEAVHRAAKAAKIHDFIMQLPDQYNTVIKDAGSNLSGGQRQRIAIARALVKQPKLLLLDEVTSALDPSAEADINALIESLRGEQTIVTVTHRLSSVVHADQIVVFDGGRVVEVGTHDELLRREGVYKQMWDKQNGFMLSGDGLSVKMTGQRLSMLPFFKGIPIEQLDIISELFVTETYEQGHVLIRENDPGDKFYIIVRGSVAVIKNGTRVALLEDGDHFGEIALLKNIPRTAEIVVYSPTILLSLSGDRLFQLVSEYPSIRSMLELSIRARYVS